MPEPVRQTALQLLQLQFVEISLYELELDKGSLFRMQLQSVMTTSPRAVRVLHWPKT